MSRRRLPTTVCSALIDHTGRQLQRAYDSTRDGAHPSAVRRRGIPTRKSPSRGPCHRGHASCRLTQCDSAATRSPVHATRLRAALHEPDDVQPISQRRLQRCHAYEVGLLSEAAQRIHLCACKRAHGARALLCACAWDCSPQQLSRRDLVRYQMQVLRPGPRQGSSQCADRHARAERVVRVGKQKRLRLPPALPATITATARSGVPSPVGPSRAE